MPFHIAVGVDSEVLGFNEQLGPTVRISTCLCLSPGGELASPITPLYCDVSLDLVVPGVIKTLQHPLPPPTLLSLYSSEGLSQCPLTTLMNVEAEDFRHSGLILISLCHRLGRPSGAR